MTLPQFLYCTFSALRFPRPLPLFPPRIDLQLLRLRPLDGDACGLGLADTIVEFITTERSCCLESQIKKHRIQNVSKKKKSK